MDKEKYHMRKILETLKKARGRHTELISVYIQPTQKLDAVINQLSQEQGTASNIKSKQTRKNVMDALEKIIQHLRRYKNTPVHGLALFSGNISTREGMQEMELWAIEPKEPVSIKTYRCDQTFLTEPLEKMLMPKNAYALIAVDNKTATLGMLKGDKYEIYEVLTSGYSGKHRAGGQSHRRFERLIAEESHRFKKRIAEHAEQIYLPSIGDITGVVIGGPAATKEEFIDGGYLNHEIQKKIIVVKDITYTDASGMRELVNACKEDLQEVESANHKVYMDRFMKYLVKEPGMVAYGEKEVEKALDLGAVDILLLSEKMDEDKIDKYVDTAQLTDVTVEIVSDEFEEGEQLWIAFGGVAAILRYVTR